MKFFDKFNKKRKEENKLGSQDIPSNNPNEQKEKYSLEDLDNALTPLEEMDNSIITRADGEDLSDQELESLFEINKKCDYSEKISYMIETFMLGFEPGVELQKLSPNIGKINLEKRGDFNYKFIPTSFGQIFLETRNSKVGEIIEGIRITGSPDFSIGLGSSVFIREEMFKLALKLVGDDDSITIFRDDLGYQRVEYTKKDIERYISSH